MRCTTDRLTFRRRGSVIMEFVIVLPLYLLLLGVAVLWGDFALRSIWVTHGDGLAAYARGDDSNSASLFLRTLLFPVGDRYEYETGGVQAQDRVFDTAGTYRTDEKFEGSWGWQVAGKVTDDYALPPWARAWLIYSEATYREESGGGSRPDSEIFRKLLNPDSVGRYPIVSRDQSVGYGTVRRYGRYTLMRTPLARRSYAPYRQWEPKDLSKSEGSPKSAYWYAHVYEEPFLSANADELDENGGQDSDKLPSKPSGRDDHSRSFFTALLSQ